MATVTIVVTQLGQADWKITASNSITVSAGTAGTSTITLMSLNGFTGTLSLTATVSPVVANGPMASLSPTSVTLSPRGTATSMLSVFTVFASPTGLFTVTVNSPNGVLSHPVTVTVTVTPALIPTLVHGKLHWTHHLSLSKSLGLQTFTATVDNFAPTAKFVQVIVKGFSDTGVPFTVRSTPQSIGAGVLTTVTFSQAVSTSFVGSKICFTATLNFGDSLDATGAIVSPQTSPVTKSGCFAVVA